MKPKIIFFGTDKFSLIVLKSLYKDQRFQIIGVVTLPHVEIINQFTRENKLHLIHLTSMKQAIGEIKKIKPDVGVLASFGKILPEEVLTIPKHGILNLHPSLLPKYRGPTPVPTVILNGDQETGVTIIKMDEKVDHGPIVAQFEESIKPGEATHDLLKKLFRAGTKELTTILPAYLDGRIELREQNHSQATYTKKFTRQDGQIDWEKTDEYLERFIRAMHPWPGAWCWVRLKSKSKIHFTSNHRLKSATPEKKRLKILKTHLESAKLVLDQVQLEGKKPVSWQQFQEGYPEAKINR